MREKAGYPWTTLPDYMFSHAAAGYGGHGTLCGALGVMAAVINIAAYDKEATYRTLVDRMMYWYANAVFPSEMFDDISDNPKQIKTPAKSPLCHISVSQWTIAAGTTVTGAEKKQRCAKVTGEVVAVVVHHLNKYFAGEWQPPKWKPSKETAHCVACHGPDDMFHSLNGTNNQQGHMECLLCHGDHTAPTDSCVECHEDEGAKLQKTETKHKDLTCNFCHKGPHPSTSTCQSCHDEPHAVEIHKKVNSCLDCHADAHDLIR